MQQTLRVGDRVEVVGRYKWCGQDVYGERGEIVEINRYPLDIIEGGAIYSVRRPGMAPIPLTRSQLVDERDGDILRTRMAALDVLEGPRVGDFVIFADGVTRRISHIWETTIDRDGIESPVASIQTSDSGSYYLGNGYVSMSGGLHPGIPGDTLTLTDERRDGGVWFFHHDYATAGGGVDVVASFRVFTCALRSDQR